MILLIISAILSLIFPQQVFAGSYDNAVITSNNTVESLQQVGKEKVVLQKKATSGKNLLTQSMINKRNTIYVISSVFSLASDINVPEGCVLEFDGGAIVDNGSHALTGYNTVINADLTQIFSADIRLAGLWAANGFYPEWFGARGDGVTDDTKAIQKVTSLELPLVLPVNREYKVTSTIEVSHSIFGNNSKIVIDENKTDYKDILHINRPPLQDPIIIRDLYVVGFDKKTKKLATGINIDGPHVILDNVKVRNFDIGIKVKKWSISIMNCHSNYNNNNLVIYSSGEGNLVTLNNDINVIGGNYGVARNIWAVKIGDKEQPDAVTRDFNCARVLLQGFCFDGGSISIEQAHTVTLDGLYGESPYKGNSNIVINSLADGKVGNVEIRNCYIRGGVHGIHIPRRTNQVYIHNNTFQNVQYCCVYTEWPCVLKYNSNMVVNPSGYPAVHTAAFDNPSRVGETPSFYDLGESDVVYGSPSGERVKAGTVFVDKDGKQTRFVGLDGYIQTTPVKGVVAKKGKSAREFVLAPEDIKKFNGGDRITLAGRNGYIRKCDYVNNIIWVYGNDFPIGGRLEHLAPKIVK